MSMTVKNKYFLGMRYRIESNTFTYSKIFHVKFSVYPADIKHISAA